MDTIRKAEERSRETARRGLDRARAGWHESERALRRRMRVNGPAAESAAPAAADRDSIQRKPIVSINGKDVGPEVVPGARRIA